MSKRTLFLNDQVVLNKDYDYEERYSIFRQAVRAVIVKDEKVAVQHVTKGFNGEFYMLPGGGIDFGESVNDALVREIAEEAGVKAEVLGELGDILEVQYRPDKDTGLVQLNHGFLCKYVKDLGKTTLTDTEQLKEMKQVWLDIGEAIENVSKGNDNDYTNFFTRQRDVKYLEIARGLLA